MIQEIEHEQLSEDRRKEIFSALVEAQDHEMNVAQSRSFVVQRFNISESRVRQIEREGMDNKWPPLCY
jgi:DNA-directed RNA polymerase sigma subunit (sigma70/sigma32)